MINESDEFTEKVNQSLKDFGTFGDIVEASRYNLLNGYIDPKFAPGNVCSFINKSPDKSSEVIKPMSLPYRSKIKGVKPFMKPSPELTSENQQEKENTSEPESTISRGDIERDKEILVE